MNLLDLLTSTMTSSSSVDALAEKTGEQSSSIKKLLMLALPLFILYMTRNASSKEGAGSLADALTQHQKTGAVEDQIADSDIEDGQKILGHVFGANESQVVDELSTRSGISSGSVIKILALLAPIILSTLRSSANHANTTATNAGGGFNLADGLDLGDVFSLFSGAAAKPQQQSSGGVMDLVGTLLGGGQKPQQSSIDGSSLISALLSVMR